MPAPHLPKGSKRMKELMSELRETESTSPRFGALIKSITANFDEFKENGGMGNSPMPLHAASPPTIDTSSKQIGGPAAGVDLSVGSPILRKDKDDAFLGYTYKRKTVSVMCGKC